MMPVIHGVINGVMLAVSSSLAVSIVAKATVTTALGLIGTSCVEAGGWLLVRTNFGIAVVEEAAVKRYFVDRKMDGAVVIAGTLADGGQKSAVASRSFQSRLLLPAERR